MKYLLPLIAVLFIACGHPQQDKVERAVRQHIKKTEPNYQVGGFGSVIDRPKYEGYGIYGVIHEYNGEDFYFTVTEDFKEVTINTEAGQAYVDVALSIE